MIECPNCGDVTKDDIFIYCEKLRKQNINISPILPTCRRCGTEVHITHICNKGKIIILNGTCGSGKSTIAEEFQNKGYLTIDGDCVIQSVRHKKGVKQYNWDELINEIACEIDILSLYSDKIVLSHIVLSEDISKYIDIFELRHMDYKFILLKPEYKTAMERCRTRTCHTSVTPEEWIKHFYEVLTFDDERVNTIDNTYKTPKECADIILSLPFIR
ncbi:MAG: hypothetical protein AB9835_13245 [Eubacteriales bacterium]